MDRPSQKDYTKRKNDQDVRTAPSIPEGIRSAASVGPPDYSIPFKPSKKAKKKSKAQKKQVFGKNSFDWSKSEDEVMSKTLSTKKNLQNKINNSVEIENQLQIFEESAKIRTKIKNLFYDVIFDAGEKPNGYQIFDELGRRNVPDTTEKFDGKGLKEVWAVAWKVIIDQDDPVMLENTVDEDVEKDSKENVKTPEEVAFSLEDFLFLMILKILLKSCICL